MFDFLFSSIVRDYLDTDASRAAGVPATAECALLTMDGDSDERDPRICVVCDEQGEGRSRQLHVVAIARGTKPRSETEPWLDAVKRRLANQAALYGHIAALPVEKRTGYQIEIISPPGAGKVQRDPMGPVEVGVGIVFFLTV